MSRKKGKGHGMSSKQAVMHKAKKQRRDKKRFAEYEAGKRAEKERKELERNERAVEDELIRKWRQGSSCMGQKREAILVWRKNAVEQRIIRVEKAKSNMFDQISSVGTWCQEALDALIYTLGKCGGDVSKMQSRTVKCDGPRWSEESYIAAWASDEYMFMREGYKIGVRTDGSPLSKRNKNPNREESSKAYWKLIDWARRNAEEDGLINSKIWERGRLNKSFDQALGCLPFKFLMYLQSQFSGDQSFANYGNGPNHWNVDHRIPIGHFSYEGAPVARALHYTNLRPLWRSDNFGRRRPVVPGDPSELQFFELEEGVQWEEGRGWMPREGPEFDSREDLAVLRDIKRLFQEREEVSTSDEIPVVPSAEEVERGTLLDYGFRTSRNSM